MRLRAVTTSAPGDVQGVIDRVNEVANASGVPTSDVVVEAVAPKQVHVVVTADFNWLFPGMFNLFGAKFTNPMPLKGEAWLRNEGTS